jgi:hypothetical protein
LTGKINYAIDVYNPFPILTPGLLDDQLARGKRYVVRQTYARGLADRSANARGPAPKAAFLLRAYFPEEKELAGQHLASLSGDPYAFLYDADDPEHLKKLQLAATQPAGYRIYYAAKKGIDWDPPEAYQEKMREYIRRHHPSWRTKPGGDKIQIGLFEEFGQLFLKFNFDEQEDTIPFEWIEKQT